MSWKQKLSDSMNSPALPGVLEELLYELDEAQTEQALAFVRRERGFPDSWGFWEIELAWAFEGLLGHSLNQFDSGSTFAVYFEEPYLNDFGPTLEDVIKAREEREPFWIRAQPFETASDGSYVLVRSNSSLSAEDLSALKQKANIVTVVGKSRLLVPLAHALAVAGKTRSSNFNYLFRAAGDGTLFDALHQAFELPETPNGDLFGRDELLSVFSEAGALHERAQQWLDLWVANNALRTHLSCFMEARRGTRDRKDIYLAWHYEPDWKSVCARKPGLNLEVLEQLGARCLLGWDWEHVDLPVGRIVLEESKPGGESAPGQTSAN